MTIVALVPNGTIAGDSHTAVIDGSDSTYAYIRRAIYTQYHLSTVAMPAGAVVKAGLVRARVANAGIGGAGGSVGDPITAYVSLRDLSGAGYESWAFTISGGTPAGIQTSGTPLNAAHTFGQAQLDDLQVWFWHVTPPYGGLGDAGEYLSKMIELFVDVLYCAPPVVTVGGPSGTILTASPTLTWTFAGDPDSDSGGMQQRYRVRVFDAATYNALGFNPGAGGAAYDTFDVTSSATSAVLGPLANATTYKAYVAAAQTVNGELHWSTWAAGSTFFVNTDPPVVATITAVPTPDTKVEYLDIGAGYITTPMTPDMAFTGPMRLTWRARIDHASTGFPGVIYKSGDFMVYATSSGATPNMGFQIVGTPSTTPTYITIHDPLTFGATHTYGVEFTPGSANMVGIIDGVRTPAVGPSAVAGVLSVSPVGVGPVGGGDIAGWVHWAQLEHIGGPVVWRFDGTEYPGTGSSYTDPRGRTWTISAPGAILAGGAVKVSVTRDTGHVNWTHVQVERSAVDVLHWQPVRGALTVAAPADLVTVYDYEQPEGVDLWYRARGLIKSGATVQVLGAWKQTSAPTVWHPGDCGEWLRGPGDPYGAVMVELVIDDGAIATEHRTGLLNVIGRASPVAVWDTPSLGTGEMRVVTRTFADGAALGSLLRSASALLYQGRNEWGHPYRWMTVTNHATARLPLNDPAWREYREWTITYVAVDAPPVLS